MYNAAATIGEQLDALAGQTVHDFEVVVADNGSTDDGPSIVAVHPVGARLVDASQQRGPGHARNVGSDAASGERLLYCDADDVADPHWVEALSGALDTWDLVGGQIEGNSLNPSNHRWVGDWLACLSAKPLPFWGAGNLAVRRSVLSEIGGWEGALPCRAGEDVELCWRAQLAGFSLGYEENAVMYRRCRGTLRDHAIQQYHYGYSQIVVRARFPQFGPQPMASRWRFAGWMVKSSPLLLRGQDRGVWVGTVACRLGSEAAVRDVYS
jgi:glycosyltransferase involved in cell wall biosynthesis